MIPQKHGFSIKSFLKILTLEQRKNFDDTSVIGGIDKFIKTWEKEIRESFAELPSVDKLLSRTYGRMEMQERQDWINTLLELLSEPKLLPTSLPNTSNQSGEDRLSSSREISSAKLTGAGLDSHISSLPGIDSKTSKKLDRLEVRTIRDLLYLFPRKHHDYSHIVKISDLTPERDSTIIVSVWEARQIQVGHKGKLKATEAIVGDETGNIRVVWFGQPYLARQLKTGIRVALSGHLEFFKRERVLQSPEYEVFDERASAIHTGRLVPIHPLTQGLNGRTLRRMIWKALKGSINNIQEFIPEDILKRIGLCDLKTAIWEAHFPSSNDSQERARQRLAFNELFIIQIAVLLRKQKWQESSQGIPIKVDDRIIESFTQGITFSLTDAQNRCIAETIQDMVRGTPSMNRLLQGEVGSGKTVVALAALIAVASNGYQGSIMVPTEILAEQHFNTVSQLVHGFSQPVLQENLVSAYMEKLARPITAGLVTGSTKKSIRRKLQGMALNGDLDILIGTQSLIQDEIEMPRIALAVIDEQHRFGVMQRAALREKGEFTPHVLIMSATPIPRTLALTLYGDLDISTIDELPPGRQKIATRWVTQDKRTAAYKFVRGQVHSGRQAFIICPLIEESEALEAKAATIEYERLSQELFPDLRLGLLHGKMSSKEKDKVITKFHEREFDILVSTPVVEVGIDVPNATVMMIEGADFFGLAQLHQFRGRVGRGDQKSYCILLADSPSEIARERLSAIEQIHDGFQLAEVDLGLRGPGDLFGIRQSGLPNLRMARLSDKELLIMAREEAAKIIQNDSDLSDERHHLLSNEVNRLQDQVNEEIS